ncbi:MAG: 50S ribosomal protein L11 methyltransferase [Clostridia bacterium]|nr:50S ribosomal protein L11 methyltransferase [Clostridia bacterium]
MEYIEVTLTLPSARAQTAVDIAEMTDIGGIYLEDYSDMMDCELVKAINLVDEDLLNRDRTTAVMHVYFEKEANLAEAMEFIEGRLGAEGIEYTVSYAQVEDTDWLNGWKKYYHPLPVGPITIVPAWQVEEYQPKEGEKLLIIDPGLAFGTGSHETTASCIEALADCVAEGDAVLDVGCGSGILSIAALLCGAKSALGIDIDPAAARVSKENAALNPFPGQFNALAGNILEEDSDPVLKAELGDRVYDLVVANIVADVIIPLSGSIRRHLKQGGYFITSGILAPRAPEVKAALEKNGFEILETKQKKEWICFIAR